MKKGALELDAMLPGTRVRSEFGTVWVKESAGWFRVMLWGVVDYRVVYSSVELPPVELVTS